MTTQPASFEFIALYETVPEPRALSGATTRPSFEVRRIEPPSNALSAALADPLQPLTPAERAAVACASGALHLQCSAPNVMARLAAATERFRILLELGATAIVLPAAHKVIGPSALRTLLGGSSDVTGLLRLFTHEHVISDAGYAWSHTHGMQHFDLPDVECRAPLEDFEMAQRLLSGVAHRLALHGVGSLQPDDLVEATDDDGVLAHFRVRPYREVDGHDYGAFGCVQIVPEPLTSSSPPPGHALAH